MNSLRVGRIFLVFLLGLSFLAWGQGGGQTPQGAGSQQAGAAGSQAGQAGARGGARGGGTSAGPGDFFTYDATATGGIPVPEGPPAETRQKIVLAGGETLAYVARAGFLPLRNPTTGQGEAHLFFTSYAREGAGDAAMRPLVFFLGGAPGVSAAWQDFGGFGPKRMKGIGGDAAGYPPYGWADNAQTLLSEADLVFVNPVGTAWSRPDQPGRGPAYWNTATDIGSLAEFVRGYLAAYDRRNSPIFLAGEDAGTGRAAGLAAFLGEHNVPVRGVALLSLTPSADAVAGDAQTLNLLPSLAMAAWFHKRLAPELNGLTAAQLADQARVFSSRAYLHALYGGDRMPPAERDKAIADLARLTGLSRAFLAANNLRPALDRVLPELLRDQKRTLSSTDARASGFAPAAGGRGGGRGGFGGAPPAPIDFAQNRLAAGFLPAYEAYLRRELGMGNVHLGLFYLAGGGIGTFASTGNDDASLAAALARNPQLRVFAGLGYFDLASPFYAAEFTLAHLSLAPDVRARNLTVRWYEAGQMPYTDAAALARMRADLAEFVAAASAPPAGR